MTKTERKKWDKDVYLLDGIEVVADDANTGKYVVIHADALDPAASMLCVARKHIKRVSYSEHRYYEGFRTDGIYKLKGATAKVETVENYTRPYNDLDTGHTERYQTISISAGSIKTLREIYTQVRQGKLKPVEDWGAHLSDVEHRERLAELARAAETGSTH